MPEFKYEAYTRQGSRVTGVEDAETSQAVYKLLQSRDLMPKSVRRRHRYRLLLSRRSRYNGQDIVFFIGELRTLLASGLGLPESLKVLAGGEEETALQHVTGQVYQLVKSGMSFSDACKRYPLYFEPLFVSALKTGEHSGDLVKPLDTLYHHLSRRLEMQRKIAQAMAYPVFLLVTFALILALMFLFVVPSFTAMYTDLSTEMPALTLWVLGVVENLPTIAALIGVLIAGILFGLHRLQNTSNGKIRLDRYKQATPFMGSFFSMLTYWQFSQALASLLRGGENLLSAVKTVRDVASNRYFAAQLDKVVQRIAHGESLSSSLRQETEFPARSLKMIAIGEEASSLEPMLESIAQYYDLLLDDRIKRITALVEPVIMLLIGAVVGVVIVALYLPVFGMVNLIGA